MKILKTALAFGIVLYLIGSSQLSVGKDISFDSKYHLDVDSLFITHLFSLESTIMCSEELVFIKPSDVRFINLVEFLSGIEVARHGYTWHPELNRAKLDEIKEWFLKHRQRIKPETISKGFKLLESLHKVFLESSGGEEIFDKYQKILDKLEELRIEYELRDVN